MNIDKNQSSYIKQLFQATPVKEIMEKEVSVVYDDSDFSAVQQIFKDTGAFYLLVINKDRKLEGLISHKFFYKTQSPRKFIDNEARYNPEFVTDPSVLLDWDSYYSKETLDSYILRNVMLKTPFTMTADEPVEKAISNMYKKNIGCIPVINVDKSVSGMITHNEIIKLLVKLIGE